MRIFLIGILGITLSLAQENRWDQWHEEQIQRYEKALTLPEEERIPIFGQMVILGYGEPKPILEGKRLEIYLLNQNALLAIPGHAEYYGKRISDAHSAYKTAVTEGKSGSNEINVFSNESMYGFQTLSQLPSPETVQVLGDMLDEEWVNSRKGLGYERWSSLGSYALKSMIKLPFANPPTKFGEYVSGSDLEKALPAWQNWYSQIKEGRRTFRFEGDPQEYNLRGPTLEALNPDIPRAKKRPFHQEAANGAGDVRSSLSNAPTITAIIVAVLIGGGYWVYRRKTVTRS